jgi:hypothetical protein
MSRDVCALGHGTPGQHGRSPAENATVEGILLDLALFGSADFVIST